MWPSMRSRKLETLSKGNQQKVQLAQTLVCDPDIIILDEPFSGLDPVNSQILKEVVQEQIDKGKLVIFSSHQMSYVEEFCQDIVIINHGDVVLSGDLAEMEDESMERTACFWRRRTGIPKSWQNWWSVSWRIWLLFIRQEKEEWCCSSCPEKTRRWSYLPWQGWILIWRALAIMSRL